MAILVNSNFINQSPTYLDARQSVKDLNALKALNINTIPEGFETYVESEDCKYKYLSSNDSTTESGKWRKSEALTDDNLDTVPTKDSKKYLNSGSIYNSLFETRTKEVIDTQENYITCESTDDGALEIVEDGTEPSATQVKLSDVTPFIADATVGSYVKHIDQVSHMEDYEDNIYRKKIDSYSADDVDEKINNINSRITEIASGGLKPLEMSDYQSFMNNLTINAAGYISDNSTTTG